MRRLLFFLSCRAQYTPPTIESYWFLRTKIDMVGNRGDIIHCSKDGKILKNYWINFFDFFRPENLQ